jgi:hypothetical protein
MGTTLSKLLSEVGDEWKGMSWKYWTPPSELWKTMPTFVLCEYGYRTWSLAALYHAIQTDRKKSLAAAVICGTANDIFFMFMPFCDNFWQVVFVCSVSSVCLSYNFVSFVFLLHEHKRCLVLTCVYLVFSCSKASFPFFLEHLFTYF